MRNNNILLLLLFFSYCSHLTYGQAKNKDSIDKVLKEISNDSLKKVKYLKLAYQYKNVDEELYFHIINSALSFGQSRTFRAKFIAEKAVYYRKRGNLDSALLNYKKAIQIFKEENNALAEHKTYASLANVYKAKGDFTNAINTLKKSIFYFEKIGDKFPQGILVNKINLGGIYIRLKDWKKADKYFMDVYKHPFAKKNTAFLNAALINLVTTKKYLKELDLGIKLAKEAALTEKRPSSLANLYNNLGNIYEEKQNYKLADSYYKKCLDYNITLKRTQAIQRTYNNLGSNATKWGKYDKAEAYLLTSKGLLTKSNNIISLEYNYDLLSNLYKKMGNYQKALDFYTKKEVVKDTLYQKEKQEAIADFEVLYETEKKEKEKRIAQQELKLSKLENTKNRNLLIGIIAITILIFISFILYFQRFKIKREAQLINLELQETQKRLAIEKEYRTSELKALKSQMNPHFIFNALNSIQDYIISNEKKLARDYLVKFSRLIRIYLEQTQQSEILLSEEIKALRLYLELEKDRFENTLDYHLSVDNTLEKDIIYLPALFIQPYVENALKHGLMHKKNDRILSVNFKKIDNATMACVITDNGVGREASSVINKKRKHIHKSFATSANRKRVALINKTRVKEDNITVNIIDLYDESQQAKGTKVYIKIPL